VRHGLTLLTSPGLTDIFDNHYSPTSRTASVIDFPPLLCFKSTACRVAEWSCSPPHGKKGCTSFTATDAAPSNVLRGLYYRLRS